MDFDVAPYISRLVAQLDGWAQIGGAADLEAIEGGIITPPAAFLVPLGESPTSAPFAGDFTQHVIVKYGAVLVISNQSDARGEAAVSELTLRRREIRDVLVKWSPDPTLGYSQRGPGSLLKFGDGLLYWMDEYFADFYERTE